jgi:hypothetical protein
MLRTKMFSLFALTFAFAGGLALVSFTGTATAAPIIADLCVATGIKLEAGVGRGGCVYASPDSPQLNVNVCWDGTTARIKGLTACPGNQRTYTAKYGDVVNPLSGEIVAYAPLADACDLVPCLPSDDNSLPFDDGVACCNPDTGDCWAPDANGNCTVGDITWCKELENNGNGTVTCHE